MSEVVDGRAVNPPMSDKDVIRYIYGRLRKEGIGIRERYAYTIDDDATYVTTNTKKSKQGNCIEITVYTVPPTEETLQKLKQKSLRDLLPSKLVQNEFEIMVKDMTPDDDIGELILDVTLVGGRVREVRTDNKSPYYNRLRVIDPLEAVLNVAFEAYRTKHQPLSTTHSTAGF